MAERKSQREASKKATKAIAAGAIVSKNRQTAKKSPTKYRSSKKSPSLPEGKLTNRKASHIQRIANAAEVNRLTCDVGISNDPIQDFNDCMFFLAFSTFSTFSTLIR